MVLLVVAAWAEFLVRGPFNENHGDLASPYVAGLRFAEGKNPYAAQDVLQDWRDAGAGQGAMLDESGKRPIYPPSTLPLMALLAPLSWPAAEAVYLSACSLLYCGLVWLLALEAGAGWHSTARLGFAAFALGLAPVHTGIHLANLSIAALLAAGYAVWLASKGRNVSAGVLLALSLCLKPTLAFTLLLACIVMRRWRMVGVCVSVAALVTAGAIVRLESIGGGWWQDYRDNLSYLFGPVGAASFSNTKYARFDLLNLQLPFYELTRSVSAANLLAWVVTGILGAGWIWIFMRRPFLLNWLPVASALLLGMMPVYQRNYNAGVAIFALLWAFQNIETRLAKAVLVVSSVFLVPGKAILQEVGSSAMQKSFLWRCFALPQMSWAISAVTVLLLIAARAGGGEKKNAKDAKEIPQRTEWTDATQDNGMTFG
jgi:hypothetical protein